MRSESPSDRSEKFLIDGPSDVFGSGHNPAFIIQQHDDCGVIEVAVCKSAIANSEQRTNRANVLSRRSQP